MKRTVLFGSIWSRRLMAKPRAYCLIRPQVHYRREAFLSGLDAAGYEIMPDSSPREPIHPDDLLVIWNRYGHYERIADRMEAGGGRVLVVENGYYGKDHNGRQPYAMAIGQHQGAGRWYWREGNEKFDRLDTLGIKLEPMDWGRPGYILVCGQRSIGSQLMRSPPKWESDMAAFIKREIDLEVRVRLHPEILARAKQPATPLLDDLAGAKAVVVWSSNVAVTSLALGIPTFHDAPNQIVGITAAWRMIPRMHTGVWTLDWDQARLTVFARMAWAQWFVDEIATGEPFELLRGV